MIPRSLGRPLCVSLLFVIPHSDLWAYDRFSILFSVKPMFIIGLQDLALEAQKLALEKTPDLGSRIDIVLTLV